MPKYVRIERTDHDSPPPKVFKVSQQPELAFAAQEALEQLRNTCFHAFSYTADENNFDKGEVRTPATTYRVRWATIKEWREGGQK